MPRGAIKSRQEILQSPFVTKTEVKRLLRVGWDEACEGFEIARDLERKELGREPICVTKAKTRLVLKAFGLTYEDMLAGGNGNV